MIRLGTPEDRVRATALLRAAHAAVAAGAFGFDPERAARLYDDHVASPEALVLVLDVEGRAEGLFVGCLAEHRYATYRLATEVVWWIEPARRGRTAATEMLARFETWARERGCQAAYVSSLANERGKRPVIAARRGYTPFETYHRKEL